MSKTIWPASFGPDDIRDWLQAAGCVIAYATGPDEVWGLLTPQDGIGAGGFRAYVTAHKIRGEWMAYAAAEAFDRSAFPAAVQDAIVLPAAEGFFGPNAPVRAVRLAKRRLAAFRKAGG